MKISEKKALRFIELNTSPRSIRALVFALTAHLLFLHALSFLILQEMNISPTRAFTWYYVAGATLFFYFSMVNLQELFIVLPEHSKIRKYYPGLNSKKGSGSTQQIDAYFPGKYWKAAPIYILPFILYLGFWSLAVLYYVLFAYSGQNGITVEASGIVFSALLLVVAAAIGLLLQFHWYRLGSAMIVFYKEGILIRSGFRTCYLPTSVITGVIRWVREDGLRQLTFRDTAGKTYNLHVKGLPGSELSRLKDSLSDLLDMLDIDSDTKIRKRNSSNRVATASNKIQHPSGTIRGRTGRW